MKSSSATANWLHCQFAHAPLSGRSPSHLMRWTAAWEREGKSWGLRVTPNPVWEPLAGGPPGVGRLTTPLVSSTTASSPAFSPPTLATWRQEQE